MAATSQSYVFPVEVWLLILRHADYKTLKRLQCVSNTFQNLLLSTTFDAALFRASNTKSIASKEGAIVSVHPILQSLGDHLELWLYRADTDSRACLAATRVSRPGPSRNKIARLLGSTTANDSAFWPPLHGSHSVLHADWSGKFFTHWIHEQSSVIGYVTIKDVVLLLMDGKACLRTLKTLGMDDTCVESSKLVGLRSGLWDEESPAGALFVEWKVVKGRK